MKPTLRGTIAVIIILIALLYAGYIEVHGAETDIVIAVPTDGDKQQDSKTIILQDNKGGQKMVHCLSTETGLIY